MIKFFLAATLFVFSTNTYSFDMAGLLDDLQPEERQTLKHRAKKPQYCYGWANCATGGTIYCYSYGAACSWRVNTNPWGVKGVSCTGYDRRGRWGTYSYWCL